MSCSTWSEAFRSDGATSTATTREVQHTTHKHTYQPATGAEGFYVPKDIPHVPLGPTVARGVYRTVFAAFAAECHIALQDGYWTDPPWRER